MHSSILPLHQLAITAAAAAAAAVHDSTTLLVKQGWTRLFIYIFVSLLLPPDSTSSHYN
jgi:hypothetical protein